MGKYSGYLICTDFDGTFYNGKEIPKRNMDAIRRFKAEGGLFTIATGRSPDFIPQYFPDYEFGVPIINLNGAVLYDIEKNETIYDRHMRGMTKALLNELIEKVPYVYQVSVFPGIECIRIPKDSISEQVSEETLATTHKLVLYIDAANSKEKSDEAFKIAKDIIGERFVLVRSALFLIEILDPELTKSAATHYLKKMTGAHTLICVGDFENDIDMVRDADIGYAVENAVDELKAVADRITVNVNDGAIAKIIEDIGN